MSDLDELYQSVIIEHDRRPRNFRELEGPHRSAEGYNPLCGDRVKVMVSVENGVITDLSFQGMGCAISKASASLMTEILKGRSVEDAARISEDFRESLTGSREAGGGSTAFPSKLNALRGVTKYPMRVKCATLAWHALRSALENSPSDD
jgi:nitrogen fixation NifU-like protein